MQILLKGLTLCLWISLGANAQQFLDGDTRPHQDGDDADAQPQHWWSWIRKSLWWKHDDKELQFSRTHVKDGEDGGSLYFYQRQPDTPLEEGDSPFTKE